MRMSREDLVNYLLLRTGAHKYDDYEDVRDRAFQLFVEGKDEYEVSWDGLGGTEGVYSEAFELLKVLMDAVDSGELVVAEDGDGGSLCPRCGCAF